MESMTQRVPHSPTSLAGKCPFDTVLTLPNTTLFEKARGFLT
jgi:hypothetical protein